jgi:hypothetical protein
MAIQHSNALRKTAFHVLRRWRPFNSRLRYKHDTVVERREQGLVAHMFKIWRGKRRFRALENRDTAQVEEAFRLKMLRKLFTAWYQERTELIAERHMEERAVQRHTDATKRKALQAMAWYGLVHRRMKAQRKEVAAMFNQRLWLQRWYDALVVKATGESEIPAVGQSFQAEINLPKPGDPRWAVRSHTHVSFGELLRPAVEAYRLGSR